jgi:CRP-like cAMP-binding protein
MIHVDQLRHVFPFAECSEQHLHLLADLAERREFKDGEPLFLRGEEALALMVVLSGQIQLELPVTILGESRNIAFEGEGPGCVVGWSSLVPPYCFTLSARAKGHALMAALPRDKLLALFEQAPELGYRIMKNVAVVIGRRLHHTLELWAREVQRGLDERYR